LKNIVDKLQSRGAGALADAELLALLIEDEELAVRLLAACGGTAAALAELRTERLRMIEGLGLRRAQRIAAAVELGRRAAAETADRIDQIRTSADVAALFRPQMEALSHEECWAVYLTSSNRIIERKLVSRGGVQGTVVDYRLVVKWALELLATQLILVHNHPSGAAEPSPQDKVLTERVAAAAALFDIRLLDHLIVSRSGHFSFMEAGLIR